MNWQHLKNSFLNNYKRTFAVFFSSLALGFVIGSFIVNAIISQGMDLVSNILNTLLLTVAAIYLLVGNTRGTFLAYRGLLIFVFYVLWDFGDFTILSVINVISSLGSNPLWITITVFLLIFAICALVSGIFCYIRTRQYLIGKYAKYEMVRLWALLFMIFVLLTNGAVVAYSFYFLVSQVSPVSIFLTLLNPLAMMALGVASFFSVLRLKSNF